MCNILKKKCICIYLINFFVSLLLLSRETLSVFGRMAITPKTVSDLGIDIIFVVPLPLKLSNTFHNGDVLVFIIGFSIKNFRFI